MTQPRVIAFSLVIVVSALVAAIASSAGARNVRSDRWNPQSAAAYLDRRQAWWESWPKAARDHGTVCVSCHTAVPYALARPALREILHETDATGMERTLVSNVVTRVREWPTIKPFYGDTTASGRVKALQSRGTEAVLNAVVLAARDRRVGLVSADARKAFANMFGMQQSRGENAGAWPWLDFDLRPWESTTSAYFGAALAAIAIGLEPQGYAQTSEVQPKLALLRSYLRSHLDESLWNRLRRRDDPRLFNRAMLLWASARLPGLLSSEERRSVVSALCAAQSDDGSWRLSALGRWRIDGDVALSREGDGYATGLIAYALQQAGTATSEAHLAHALGWLAAHQDAGTGMWSAASLNKRRDPSTNVGKFMSDAATAYAVLALAAAQP